MHVAKLISGKTSYTSDLQAACVFTHEKCLIDDMQPEV
jgi:hypothetical protein